MNAGQTNVLTLSGGSLEVDTAGTWLVGGNYGIGTLNMDAGLLKTGNLRIDLDKPGGFGRAFMTGGTIDLSGVLRIGTNGVLDILGGEVVTKGLDDTAMLQSYINSGQITGSPALAYDGTNTYLFYNTASYEAWAVDNELTTGENDARTDDPEPDGMENLLEYAFGGNPLTNDAAIFLPTSEFTADSMEYVYCRRVDFALRDLVYDLVINTNGLHVPWTNVGSNFVTGTGPIDATFESVTNTFPTTRTDLGFINLEVTEN